MTQLHFPFLLIGRGAGDSAIREAKKHNDTVFLDAPAGLSYRAGQLQKTWSWLQCAVNLYSEAHLLGKADDDTWLDVVGIEQHLRKSYYLAQSLTHAKTHAALYWGAFESYHWHLQRHRPLGHKFGFARYETKDGAEHCLRRAHPPRMAASISNAQQEIGYGELKALPGAELAAVANVSSRLSLPVVGPFHFAKGPLYCLSTILVRRMVQSTFVHSLAAAAMSSRVGRAEVMWPFEDVFVGLSLAHAASDVEHGGEPLFAVDMGESGIQFIEEFGILVGRATLVWHMKTKRPSRISAVDRWRTTNRCYRQPSTMRMDCLTPSYIACSGSSWHRCTTAYPKKVPRGHRHCDTKAVDLRWPNGTLKV